MSILDLIENVFVQDYGADREIETETLEELHAAVWAELMDREVENDAPAPPQEVYE